MTSSYPENGSQSNPSDYISIWHSGDKEYKWHTAIEIGRDRSYLPTGGGNGTVMIEIVPQRTDEILSKNLSIAIEIGSAEKEGTKILGINSIEVPLKEEPKNK